MVQPPASVLTTLAFGMLQKVSWASSRLSALHGLHTLRAGVETSGRRSQPSLNWVAF